LKDELLRVSNRVLQHIVDNESAVNDIVETYTQDGQHSLQLLFESHEQEFNTMHKDVKQKKAKMNKATEQALLKLRKERQNIEDENE
jgi:Skp family chaperone for outer membrane proteins